MLKFSDLSTGDYVLWASQRSNMDGDYDLFWTVSKLQLADFSYIGENGWNERDLNEFVKPIEITHDIMVHKLKWHRVETWAGIVEYKFEEFVKDGVEYNGLKFNTKNIITIEMDKESDRVKNIKFDCFNQYGYFNGEKCTCDGHFYLHELQHIIRDCGIEKEIELGTIYLLSTKVP